MKNNTNLIGFSYVSFIENQDGLSPKIQQKLNANRELFIKQASTQYALQDLQDPNWVNRMLDALDECVKTNVNGVLNPNTSVFDLNFNKSYLSHSINEFSNKIQQAEEDSNFKNQPDYQNIKKNYRFYYHQLFLLKALDDMHQYALTTKSDDRNTLLNLRQDLLNDWKNVYDQPENAHEHMLAFINKMITRCHNDSAKVHDKTSYAFIKNLLLILSAICTLGLSLIVYAAVTKQARKSRNSFFYQNMELSKTKIDDVLSNLNGIHEQLNPIQPN